MLNKAIQFATLCHSNQKRKASKIPYITHCLEAGIIASNLTNKGNEIDEEIVAAAILHDTIEDALVSYENLKEIFNERIAGLVRYQSEDKSKDWLTRKEYTIDFINSNKLKNIEILILADKLSNMRSMYRDYKLHGEKLWDKFNAGKESQYWYYNSIAVGLKQVKETDEYREYIDLIDRTFKS